MAAFTLCAIIYARIYWSHYVPCCFATGS